MIRVCLTGLLVGLFMSGVITSDAAVNSDAAVEGELSSLAGATEWVNSPPLTQAGLRGKVVLVEFWTYTCINWRRTEPF
jgi:hypothetical protein